MKKEIDYIAEEKLKEITKDLIELQDSAIYINYEKGGFILIKGWFRYE